MIRNDRSTVSTAFLGVLVTSRCESDPGRRQGADRTDVRADHITPAGRWAADRVLDPDGVWDNTAENRWAEGRMLMIRIVGRMVFNADHRRVFDRLAQQGPDGRSMRT